MDRREVKTQLSSSQQSGVLINTCAPEAWGRLIAAGDESSVVWTHSLFYGTRQCKRVLCKRDLMLGNRSTVSYRTFACKLATYA